ncbi:ferritin-like domain-containing protein [Chloroflexota bacterium]
MDNNEIIALLNKDIEGEHGAIIQYLAHAYAVGEGEVTCEIEALAREEMRHLDWLAETVVELGGVPSIKRGGMRMGGDSVSDWMNNNVLLEEDAIKLYKEHIEAIDNKKIKRLLTRILSDEESHHGDFEHFVDKVKKEGLIDIRGNRDDHLVQVLNWGIEHEYTVILQYLFQSYMVKDPEAQKELSDQAINEMQHLGWLAEKIVDINSNPLIEHAKVDQSTDKDEMLKVDIKIEKEVAAAYDRAAKETDDPELKTLLNRIRDHEIYHTEIFSDMLND